MGFEGLGYAYATGASLLNRERATVRDGLEVPGAANYVLVVEPDRRQGERHWVPGSYSDPLGNLAFLSDNQSFAEDDYTNTHGLRG